RMRDPTASPAATRFAPGEGVVWNEAQGQMVLLNARTGTYFALDEVGAEIWKLLLSHRSAVPVVEAMQELFDVDPATLSADVHRLIGELLEHGLLAPEQDVTQPAEAG